MNAKIVITLKSFESKESCFVPFFHEDPWVLTRSTRELKPNSKVSSIALPKKQSLFTVLRSPHIDKKSRDQFQFLVYKKLITIHTEIKQLRNKLMKLKLHGIPGVQMKVVFQSRTRLRLDMLA